jgi:hypothetical protein
VVDFAIEAPRNRGLAPVDTIRVAWLQRFRPIMKTTMAALLGGVPLMLGTGTGVGIRQPLSYHRIPRVDYEEIAGIAKPLIRQLQAHRARTTTLHGAQLRFGLSEQLKFLARIQGCRWQHPLQNRQGAPCRGELDDLIAMLGIETQEALEIVIRFGIGLPDVFEEHIISAWHHRFLSWSGAGGDQLHLRIPAEPEVTNRGTPDRVTLERVCWEQDAFAPFRKQTRRAPGRTPRPPPTAPIVIIYGDGSQKRRNFSRS